MHDSLNIVEFDDYGLCNQVQDGVDLFVSIDVNRKSDALPNHQQTVFNSISDESQVYDSIMQQCEIIAKQLQTHPLVAFLILQAKNWNLHEVYETWAEFGDSILQDLGITRDNLLRDPSLACHPPSEDIFECEVCCLEYPAKEMWGLTCGHYFCLDCWRAYAEAEINMGHNIISCQAQNCKCKLPPNSIKQLCGDKTYENLMRFIQNNQVSLADSLTHCPKETCGKPVNALEIGLCNVLKCSCGYEFCSICKQKSHAPATCSEKQVWELETEDDKMNKRLFGENFKPCPKCRASIEKNGGCNYMKCIHCNHQFCWLCLVDWTKHSQDHFHCPNYKKENDIYLKKADYLNPAFISLYQDPFNRIQMENQAFLNLIPKLSTDLFKKCQGASDTQFTRDCITNLLNSIYWANETFKWTYIHLFYKRYVIIKNQPHEIQVDFKKCPNTVEYNLCEFALNNAIQVVSDIQKRLVNAPSTNVSIPLNYFLSAQKKVTNMRNTVMKHCDPHYR